MGNSIMYEGLDKKIGLFCQLYG